MEGMMMHCGSEMVTREKVNAVPVPKHTKSWCPVSYEESIDFMHGVAEELLKMPVKSEQYGLNQNGDQMFGLLTLDSGNAEHGLSIGLRGSYNKSLANAVAVGAKVFVCDNLCFSGDAFKVVRKNTVNVWRDFRNLILAQVGKALGHYDDVQADMQKLKSMGCDLREGYSFLGVMLGEKILTPTQANVAFGDWTKPRYDEFMPRTLWSLYNAVTEGLKKGAPARMLDRHATAHDFLIRQAA